MPTIDASRPAGLPDYSGTTAAGIERETATAIAAAEALVEAALVSDTAPILDAVSDAARLVWSAYGSGAFLALVHPDAVIRDAAMTAGEQIEGWRAALLQRSDVLRELERLDAARLDEAARDARDRLVGIMRRAGAHLGVATRSELAGHQARLAQLQSTYIANQNADRASITVEGSRLAGLPPDALAALEADDDDGTLIVPIGLRPLVLETVRDRGVREAIQRRWLEVARESNTSVFRELFEVRRQVADLLGQPSWADLRAGAGMAGSLPRIEQFLDDIGAPFQAAVATQLDAIRIELAREAGVDPSTYTVEDWDVARGVALVRGRLGSESGQLREYLPLDRVLEGLGGAVEVTFGVQVTKSPASFAWHPDVQRLDLADAATGRAIGTILLDLFAREGKMPGAAGMCDVLALGVPGDDPNTTLTHTALVLYLTPIRDGPVLLTPQDLEALFHELGHALDYMLGSARFAPVESGAWIPDWIEAPSQSIGRWALMPEVLRALSGHHQTGAPMPVEMAEGHASAARTGAALDNVRLLWFARLDLVLHGPSDVDLDEAWQRTWPVRGTPLATEQFSPSPLFPIALGYEGSAYGFLWAQVLMDEILGRFEREGALSPEVGAAYRRELLEPGWAPDANPRMRRFLDREPTIEPFLNRLAGAT